MKYTFFLCFFLHLVLDNIGVIFTSLDVNYYFSAQQLIPFIDYHLVFFYKYFDDLAQLNQIQDGIKQHYKNMEFEKTTSKYLEQLIEILCNG